MACGAQPAKKGRVGPCGGQLSVTSYISGGRDGVPGRKRASGDGVVVEAG